MHTPAMANGGYAVVLMANNGYSLGNGGCEMANGVCIMANGDFAMANVVCMANSGCAMANDIYVMAMTVVRWPTMPLLVTQFGGCVG